MKKYILKSLFVSMLCMLAASCQDTDEFAQTVDSSKTQVMFTIAMDSPLSRSGNNTTDTSWGGTYENCVGDDYDNRIALNQLVAEIETAEGKKYPVSGIISEDNKYSFVGVVENIKSSITLENVKITIFANMGDKAQKRTFDQTEDFIPMWGFQTMSELKLEPGTRAKIDPISLLRAMAKIEVALNEEMAQDYTLSAVTLNKYNEKGNSLPTIPTSNDGKPSVQNTKQLDQENVFNVNQSEGKELRFVKNETNASWSVYLPEVKNNGDLEITVEFDNGDTGKFKVMDYNYEEPLAMDIVRNHWYKYTISGFAESEIQVSYNTVGWEEKFIEIGGDGFLFLNKDVIEIYNSNIDADQLTFASSSPIKSIVLKDIYKHENNGTFTEGTKEIVDGETVYDGDDLSAYYITKFGQKIQLGTYPGFDVEEGAKENEDKILNAISAVPVYDETGLNGGITINSPYIGHATFGDSHYNTIRYLEFEVTNEQDLTATFRVMQYPPVVISNIEGYFSYRDDFTRKDGEEPAYWTNYMGNGSVTTMGIILTHEHDWTDEKNQSEEWFNTRQSDRSYAWTTDCEPQGKGKERWEEMRYSLIGHYVNYKSGSTEKSGFYSGGYRPMDHTGVPTRMFFRERYHGLPGPSNMDTQGAAVSDPYEKVVINENGEPETRIFRKHYTWDIQTIFWSRYVKKVHMEDSEITVSNKKYKRLKGQASMYNIADNYTTYKDGGEIFKDEDVIDGGFKFVDYGITGTYRNHRMYHIKTTTTSDKYILGFPTLLDEEGNPTTDVDRGVVDNTPSNANLVSPSLMLASQLGETNYNYIIDNCKVHDYVLPKLSDFYELAKRHCREYVESTWEDTNGNGQPDEGEPVTQYHDWRLPTKAEIEMIIDYQDKSRAMDVVLMGEHFVCVTGQPGQGDDEKYWVSSEVPTYKATAAEDIDGRGYEYTGYYIRCVRDVKPEVKNGSNNKIK